jgi:predicted nucleic acid-binding protein
VLRRQVLRGEIDARRVGLALDDLAMLPLERAPHQPLIRRCWQLRENVTIYGAAYVALAEALGVTLLTGDRRLAGATGPECHIELLNPS